jgi:protein-disulfide isomerase
VKLVIKHFPLKNHKYAAKAARAALAAGMQGKFWEFHQKLFENYKSIDDSKIEKIAEELSLDLEKFRTDMNGSAIQALIKRDIRNGVKVGVRGTPTVFINGKILKNRKPQGFYRMIEAELTKKKQMMKGKTR